jgi:MerR family transcriptional regulator, heat shock protein HspR
MASSKINEEDRPLFTISVVADLIGVSAHTLRLYESSGLIIPRRTDSQRRLYSRADIVRLQSIRDLIENHGLNLAGIQSLISMIPCWNLKQCKKRDRKKCDAYNSVTEPCWAANSSKGSCSNGNCIDCPIYKSSTPLTRLKENLLHDK